MRDEHFYTRALKLNPERAVEYYIGRAEFYYREHKYKKACKDYLKAKKMGADDSDTPFSKIFKEFLCADNRIKELSEEIIKTPNNDYLYHCRAYYYLRKKQFGKSIVDIEKAIELCPSYSNYTAMDDITQTIREITIFNLVDNAKNKNLISAYKQRLNYAKEQIVVSNHSDYWEYKAEKDLDAIIKHSKDKTLALYFKVNFYENLMRHRASKNDNLCFRKVIFLCKKVVEQSMNRTDILGKALTYLYKIKLVSLYSNEEDFANAIKMAMLVPDKPTTEYLKKGLEYINNFAHIDVNVLRTNWVEDGIVEYMKDIK